jgi:hypothetical protein
LYERSTTELEDREKKDPGDGVAGNNGRKSLLQSFPFLSLLLLPLFALSMHWVYFILMAVHLPACSVVGAGVKTSFVVHRMAFMHLHRQRTSSTRKTSVRLFSTEQPNSVSTRTITNVDAISDPLEPFTWPQLVDFFRHPDKNNHFVPSNHPKLELFRRSQAVQSTYLKHQSKLKREWKSAYDYLCVKKFGKEFGFTSTRTDDGNKYESTPSLEGASHYAIQNKLRYLSLVRNDFPYDVCSEINHYCLWKIGGASAGEGILQDEMKWAITELTKCSQDDFVGSNLIVNSDIVQHYATKHEFSHDDHGIIDYLYWVNPPHLQSMPALAHAHILVLRGENGDAINLGNLENPLSPLRSKL